MTEITNEKAFSMEVRIENFPNLREQISEVETHHGMKWSVDQLISRNDKKQQVHSRNTHS